MCSLCITSITNINARLSAGGKGGGQEYVCSLSVHMCRCKCVYLVCVCVCVFLYKDSQKGFYENSLGQTGGCDTRDTAKEMHSLFRYNKYRGL